MRTITRVGRVWKLFEEDELSPDDLALMNDAKEASALAKPQFSEFPVGACVRIKEKPDPYSGWNVEDGSLVAVLHAEQAALNAAVNANRGPVRVQTIAIWGHGDVPPCGRCRQMIVDSNPDARVLFPYEGGILVARATELLPLEFKLGK